MTDTASPRDDFLTQLAASVREGSLLKLTLGKPRGADESLRQLLVRPVTLRGTPHFSFVWRHETQGHPHRRTILARRRRLRNAEPAGRHGFL